MYFNFSIRNFFYKKEEFKKYFSYYKQLTKNKNFEAEISYYNYDLLKIEINCNIIGADHAGLEFCFVLLGYEIDLKIYDSRHWDYKKWCWQNKSHTNT